ADDHVRIHVDIFWLEVKHVLAAGDIPAAAEAGAVVENLLVWTQLDLRSDAQARAHLIDAIGLILILRKYLRLRARRKTRERQACCPDQGKTVDSLHGRP